MSDDTSTRRRIRQVAGEARDRLRDRRRKERQRLEDLFGRKTVVSVGFTGGMTKFVETALIPLMSRKPLYWDVAGAWAVFTLTALVVAVYWKELSRRASEAADAVEDAAGGE